MFGEGAKPIGGGPLPPSPYGSYGPEYKHEMINIETVTTWKNFQNKSKNQCKINT